MNLEPGDRLGSYEILSALGAGGMGEVYRARHVKLGRDVAIKVLPSDVAADPERLKRFEREARSASALNHPNVVTIHDIGEHGGTTYIAMELVEGRTLRELVREGPLPVRETVDLASQICDGLAKAHAGGIVHRDLKPDNVMVTGDGLVKILDFGLAKPVAKRQALDTADGSAAPTLTKSTAEGAVMGTVYYMSPEQAAGTPVDHRSDQFSFGVLLYELLCGRRPFEGSSAATVLSSILRDTPAPPRTVRPDTPRELEHVVARCLEKDPNARYGSMGAVRDELRRFQDRSELSGRNAVAVLKAAVLLLAVVGVVVGGWSWLRSSRARWAHGEAIPEINRLIDEGNLYEAYRLGVEARRYIPDDPDLGSILGRITLPIPVVTNPEGADVYMKDYKTPDAPWEHLGRTPIGDVGVPYTLLRVKIEKDGYETIELAPMGGGVLGALASGLALEPLGERPDGMVALPAGFFFGSVALEAPNELPAVPVGGFWLDRYEVTNRKFQEFVAARGYDDPELWAELVGSVGEARWSEAVASFRDATDWQGPSSWQLRSFPEGTDEHPVSGVSWYEAAAYCRFAGKRLPTIYHWLYAAEQAQLSDILNFSNFEGDALAPVGEYQGLGPFGTYDMAGNVKEWCANATEQGARYILGGAVDDPEYMYGHLAAQDPLDRSSTNGFRCARYTEAPGPDLVAPVTPRSFGSDVTPVGDDVYRGFVSLYEYERTGVTGEVESVDDSSPIHRKETVSFDAAYGGERIRALLFLPNNAEPPFQAVVWFPGNDVFIPRSHENLASAFLFDFIPRSGRALVYPIYRGTYERFEPFSSEPNKLRDSIVQWSRELGRTVDYLETRDDIDGDRLAYYGFSSGATYAPIFTAIDPRFEASVMLAGGLWPTLSKRPEMDVVNFAPRSHVPALMINGRDDFLAPYEDAQLPLFRLLGAPDARKRHARLEGGHIPSMRLDIIREVLDWLDEYLGPVELK